MSRTRRGIAATVAGRAWGVVSVYLFVPIYLRFLGTEAYGIVGFFALMQGVLAVADLGLTSTMSREMARLGARDDLRDERPDVARSIELIYGAIALAVGLGVAIAAPAIADHWLQLRTLDRGEVIGALRLMGVTLAMQLPIGLYAGGLMGLERQVTANVLQVAWSTVRSAGAALALWLLAPTLRTFFVVVAVTNALFLVAIAAAYWRALGATGRPRFRAGILRRVLPFSLGMAGMTVLSIALFQLDKAVVSRMFTLEVFAHYSLAATLAQVPVIVGAAIAAALFPRLTALATGGTGDALRGFYHEACQLVSVGTIPLGLTLAAFAPEVLAFWTRSLGTAEVTGPAATLLMLGSTALAVQAVPYQLALAHGWVGLNLRLGIVSVLLFAPALWWLCSRFGLVGAGAAWLALNLLTLPPMIVWLHRRVLPGATTRWVLEDALRPLAAAAIVILPARLLVPAGGPPARGFVVALLAGAVALAAAALVSPVIRRRLPGARAAGAAS